MSELTPTDSYYKTKRAAVVACGLLLLSVFFTGQDPEKERSIFDLIVLEEKNVSLAFAGVTLYCTFQLILNWFLQTEIVRSYVGSRVDFYFSSVICLSSLQIYLLSYPAYLYLSFSLIFGFCIFIFSFISWPSSGSSREVIAKNNRKIEVLLFLYNWVLVFNPLSPNGKKEIEFLPDGSIGKGANKNEHNWRINYGFLEILTPEGLIFSRFKYNDEKESFEHTNDPDTLSLRNQEIVRVLK